MATWQGATVTWGGVAVGKVVSGSPTKTNNMVDCTTIADTQTDMRSGNKNPTASLTISMKDSGTNPFTIDQHDTLVIGDEFSDIMRVSGMSAAIEVDAHEAYTIEFVSTAEAVA